VTQSVSIVIIGSGFSGLGMAIRLKQEGIQDFIVLERAQDVGGTWRDNTYPGCACDVESHLYSYSFAPNPRWSRMFSPQAEIWQYLRDCADRFGVRPHMRFGHEVNEANWDEKARGWRIKTSRGEIEAKVLISGMGALCEPKWPDIPGLDRFKGKLMHSARWDHGYELSGKRVAVVGTGASAIQFVPRIQPLVAELKLFQRTPPWIVPHTDRPIAELERRLFARHPRVQKALRGQIFAMREALGVAFRHPLMMRAIQQLALRHLRRSVSDRALRAKLTPKYKIGCKRILLSNDYYPAVSRANVEVVTEAIREVRESSVVTADGRDREVDAIILGTGFEVTEVPFAKAVRGREGKSLGEAWNHTPRAHLGTTVAGFPNLFLLLGPGTGLGHNSVVLMIESQIEHVLRALDYMRTRRIAALEPKGDAQKSFERELDRRMSKTVWVRGGCSSWYQDRNGTVSTLWPGSVPSFKRRVERFNPSEYAQWKQPSVSKS
jgi:cation diffusion facilitator CzcD-associated flavoprotein CzcO